jgi:transposase
MEGSNRRYVGIDLAKRTMEVCILRPDGKSTRWSSKTDVEGRKRLAKQLGADDVVGVEACVFAFSLERYLRQVVGCEVIVLNAGRLAIIHQSTNKTDRLDAYRIGLMISRFDRSELPEVSVPSEQEEEMRTYVSAKQFFVSSRTRAVNRLHALYVQAGITNVESRDLKTHDEREKSSQILTGFLLVTAKAIGNEIDVAESNVEMLEKKLRDLAAAHELTPFLLSVPGVGPNVVAAFLAYIGDGSRFATAAQVAAYAGLVPRVDCSGDTEIRGSITKFGNPVLRKLLMQAAWSMTRAKDDGWLKITYAYFVEHKGKLKSIVALARKMLELLWILARRHEYYTGCSKAQLEKKLKRYGIEKMERAA